MLKTSTGYLASQIWLHWLVALLLIPQFLLNDSMKEAWRAIQRGNEVAPSIFIQLHVIGGVTILVLVLWRLVLRMTHGAPLPPEDESAALKLVATLTHGVLVSVAGAFGG